MLKLLAIIPFLILTASVWALWSNRAYYADINSNNYLEVKSAPLECLSPIEDSKQPETPQTIDFKNMKGLFA